MTASNSSGFDCSQRSSMAASDGGESTSTTCPSDMVMLESISEDTIFDCLCERFNNDSIYTHAGEIIVSINPYKRLPIYTQKISLDFLSESFNTLLSVHLYSLVSAAYRATTHSRVNTAIIIAGESGSGKTEASKIILGFIGHVSQDLHDNIELSGTSPSVSATGNVRELLLQSNPILEAFGNAATLRNSNSSRFGKYFETSFDFLGRPQGGHIDALLLERSRVVGHTIGERAFHVFYAMLAGHPEDRLEKLGLTADASIFTYLRSGSVCEQSVGSPHHSLTIAVLSEEDVQQYEELISCMTSIGFTSEDIDLVFEVVAIVLLLGNIVFEESTSASVAHTLQGADAVATLLGCSSEALSHALTHRRLDVRASYESHELSLSVKQAVETRDAVAKLLYHALFSWVVQRINESIAWNKESSDSKYNSTMGVLDIYGFEIFPHNTLEQFNINYCNEKLQQVFIELTLKREQAEYHKEGIPWEDIDFLNNEAIVELIERHPLGIMPLLDEECLLPRTTAASFMGKLAHCHANTKDLMLPRSSLKRGRSSTHLTSMDYSISNAKVSNTQFAVAHYAGQVVYDTTSFLEKNKDTLFRNGTELLSRDATHSLVCEMFPYIDSSNNRRPATVVTQFKTQVTTLCATLIKQTPYYIRCIKPNHLAVPNEIDKTLVREQIRYLGLTESVRVRRAGYCFRQPFIEFSARYGMLNPSLMREAQCAVRVSDEFDVSTITRSILSYVGISSSAYRLGKTKVFIKEPCTLVVLEKKRMALLPALVTLMQRIWRGYAARLRTRRERAARLLQACVRGWIVRRYMRYKQSVITCQATIRGWICRRNLRQYKAATLISSAFRMWCCRVKFLRMRAAVKLQSFFRTIDARRRWLKHRRDIRAAVLIQAWVRGRQTRSKLPQITAALKLQRYIQRWLGRRNHAAVRIQKVWRGCRTRHSLRRINAAVLRMQFCFRYRKRKAASECMQRRWITFISRRRFLRKRAAISLLQRVYRIHRARTYLLSLAENFANASIVNGCPTPPLCLRSIWPELVSKWTVNKARHFMASLTPQRHQELVAKTAANEIFTGKKQSYARSIPLPFHGDTLDVAAGSWWANASAAHGSSEILFSSTVSKVNRNGHLNSAVVVLTREHLYRLDSKGRNVKETRSLSTLDSIILSPYADAFILLHFCDVGGEELLLLCESFVEFVTVIWTCSEKRPAISFAASEAKYHRRSSNHNSKSDFSLRFLPCDEKHNVNQLKVRGKELQITCATSDVSLSSPHVKTRRKSLFNK